MYAQSSIGSSIENERMPLLYAKVYCNQQKHNFILNKKAICDCLSFMRFEVSFLSKKFLTVLLSKGRRDCYLRYLFHSQ